MKMSWMEMRRFLSVFWCPSIVNGFGMWSSELGALSLGRPKWHFALMTMRMSSEREGVMISFPCVFPFSKWFLHLLLFYPHLLLQIKIMGSFTASEGHFRRQTGQKEDLIQFNDSIQRESRQVGVDFISNSIRLFLKL